MPHRLPTCVSPKRYDLELATEFNPPSYNGKITIECEIKEATDKIVFNCHELEITAYRLINSDVNVIALEKDVENQMAIIKLDKTLQPSSHIQLFLEYNAELTSQMRGYYLSTYEFEGAKQFLATTHFEPSNARCAFPCWDEPCFKAVFAIKLVAPPNMIAISNMAVKRSEPIRNEGDSGATHKTLFEFADTPLMSTYIVAFAVGNLQFVEAEPSSSGDNPAAAAATNNDDSPPPRIRVYTRPGIDAERVSVFALSVASKCYAFYKHWFDMSFELDKLDLFAVPDFPLGGMENWGLITFKEKCLLIDPQLSSNATRRSTALMIAHEISHMWFGDLVTMYWWTDLWLKEGFATWIEYLCVDALFPNLEIWTFFVQREYMMTLDLDSMRNSHPIEIEVRTTQDIEEIFDAISYRKGASVIRMLSRFLGLEVFQRGLQLYLRRHKFANATTRDLWSALSDVSGVDVAHVMHAWTAQMGFPVLHVCARPASRDFTIQQEQFFSSSSPQSSSSASFSSSSSCSSEEERRTWRVPLFHRSVLAAAAPPQNARQANIGSLLLPAEHAPHKHTVTLDELKAAANDATHDDDVTTTTTTTDKDDVDERSALFSQLFKPDGVTICRVHYENEEHFDWLVDSAASEELWDDRKKVTSTHTSSVHRWSRRDLAAFMEDAYALARTGHIAWSKVLRMNRALASRHSHYTVWSSLLDSLLGIKTYLQEHRQPEHRQQLEGGGDDSPLALFHRFCVAMIRPAFNRLGLDCKPGEPENDTMLRCLLMRQLGLMGDPEVIAHARHRFETHLAALEANQQPAESQSQPIPANQKQCVYSVVMSALPDTAHLERVIRLFKASAASNEEQTRILINMASAPLHAGLFDRALHFILWDEAVRDQDRLNGIISAANAGREQRRAVWAALKRDWPRYKRLYQSQFNMKSLLKGCLIDFCDLVVAHDIQKFFEENESTAPRTVSQILETIKSNAAFCERFLPEINQYFEQHC